MAKNAKLSAPHKKFIQLIAKGFTQQKAYTTSFSNKTPAKATASSEGSVLAKKYAVEIQQEKERGLLAQTDAYETDEAQKALKSVVSQANADTKSFRILGQDDLVDDYYYLRGVPTHYLRKPSQIELQKSYALYCARFGSNASNKLDITSKGESIKQTVIKWGDKEIVI